MKAMKPVYLLMISVILMGCTPEKDQDLLESELKKADLAFSDMSLREGTNSAFAAFCAREGVLLRENAMPIVGKEAVEELLGKTDDEAFELTWEPAHARVAASGDLGYTYGLYSLKLLAADTTLRGTYVSVWIHEEGEWKWVLDTGNEGLGE